MEYEFRSTPFDHQRTEWDFSRALPARAVFWEQGTGKSKLTIDTACAMFESGLIDAVIVVAPNGVHRNWVTDEIPTHVPERIMSRVRAFAFASPKAGTKRHQNAVTAVLKHDGFSWLTISYDAFMTKNGKAALIDFFDRRRVLYVLDESHNIKTPNAERTKSVLRSAKYGAFRRILTGTPTSQGPFDMYSQIKFLEADFWKRAGFGTFTEFKAHFGIWTKGWNASTGKEYDQCVGYRRLDQLNALLAPIATRVTKDQVLDLPPKRFDKLAFDMTDEQRAMYEQMRDEFVVWLNSPETSADLAAIPAEADCPTCGGTRELEQDGFIYPCPDCEAADGRAVADSDALPVIADLAIVRLLRLQQITCGYLPTGDELEPYHTIPGPNRRLEATLDAIEAFPRKVIVWARFQRDVTLILEGLAARGIRAVRYDGLAGEDEREEAKALFKGWRPTFDAAGSVIGREKVPPEEQAKVFVGNPAVGATGLTLVEAKMVIYYSNSFKLIDRLQSEDRAHRIGQEDEVVYLDVVANRSVDEKIVEALRNKFNIASQIVGDRLKEWI